MLYLSLPAPKESEGYDRPDLDLTSHQVALIKAVSAVQPNTVVILNNGAPVVMSEWIEGTAAVLEAWMMGQAGGGAIAGVLYGKVNPSGVNDHGVGILACDLIAFRQGYDTFGIGSKSRFRAAALAASSMSSSLR